MSIFSRRPGDEEAQMAFAGSLPRSLPSPEGWYDTALSWPEGRSRRYAHLFPGPGDAVSEVERLGRMLAKRRDAEMVGKRALAVFGEQAKPDLVAYALAVQALNLGQEMVVPFKGSFGRLAAVLARHLVEIPEVTTFRLVGSYMRAIGEDLRDGDDPDLEALGSRLLSQLSEVRKVREEGPVEHRPELSGGTTASVGEEFMARYRAPRDELGEEATEGLPVDDELEEQAPPEDLTAEAVFRVLLEECIGDGHFSKAETRCIIQIRSMLGISLGRHAALLKEVQREFHAGNLTGTEDMDPLTFFERCCRIALADGVVDDSEHSLIRTLGKYLHITPDEFADIRGRLGR